MATLETGSAQAGSFEAGLDSKTLSFAKKVIAKAQQEKSMLYDHCEKKDLTGIGADFVEVVDTQTPAKKARGTMARTDWQTQGSDRTRIDAELHYTAITVPLDEIGTTQSDKIKTGLAQGAMGLGRAMDKELITAQISPRFTSTDSSAGDTSAGTAARHAANAYAAVTGLSDTNALPAFTADTLADIRKVFRKRNVLSGLCATLTPELANTLEKDSDFKNAENVYSIKSEVEQRDGFMYKGIKFVTVSEDVLPTLGTNNIGISNAANIGAAVDVIVRDVNHPNRNAGEAAAAANSVAKAKAATDHSGTALGGTFAIATVSSDNLVYFWQPMGLYLGERSNVFIREGSLPEWTFSAYGAIGSQFGAAVADRNRTLVYAIAGTCKTALA